MCDDYSILHIETQYNNELSSAKIEEYDSRVKSLFPRQACLTVGTRLNDPLPHEQEVGRMPHEIANAGRIVGVRSTEQSVNHLLPLTSYYYTRFC